MAIGADTLYCPAPPVLRAGQPGAGTWAGGLHKAYVHELSRKRDRKGRLVLLARCPLAPAAIACATTYFTRHNGAAVHRRTGR